MRISQVLAITILATVSTPALAKTPCGGSLPTFLRGIKQEAVSMGHAPATVDRFLRGVALDPKVIRADRAQGIFKKDFIQFSRAVISQSRLKNGRRYARKYAAVFKRAERDYGVSRGVLLALWAFETDFGQVQGNFNTLNSLVTLARDCRRPELFRPQIMAALSLYEKGDFSPSRTKGAWAGEIGMVQMLPRDILENGVDGDGDGYVRVKTSMADALLSGAKMLRGLGWRAREPWLQQIILPRNLDWAQTGLDHQMPVAKWQKLGIKARTGKLGKASLAASVLLPMGRKGPAFLAYPNFRVYFEWNKSFIYVISAAYFATRLQGAPVYNAGRPDPALSDAQMKALQRKLVARGYDVGKIDGIIGAKTRAAVQSEQTRLGLPADAWPTPELLNRL